MFLDFFFHLRSRKIPISTSEYLDLLEVLRKIDFESPVFNLERFYHIARNCLIKDLKYYDAFDLAFAETFQGFASHSSLKSKLEEWLAQALQKQLSAEQMANALKIPPEDLMKELQKRLEEQKERHDGGNKWIGTGGTSPFGHSGFNPEGIRVGGTSRNRSALAVAGERHFKEYRSDQSLHIRQIKVALKGLRELKSSGRPELCLKSTIRKSCDNGGEIDLVFRRSRKNHLRLLLLMDVGGSMTPFARQVEQIFSAAHQVNHFKEFHHFYFHNIFYGFMYKNASLRRSESIPMSDFYRKWPQDTKVIFVGDALMAPYELFQMNQNMSDAYRTLDLHGLRRPHSHDLTGLQRLIEFRKRFPNSVWLNPEDPSFWGETTIAAIQEQIPMFYLSLDGLKKAIDDLMSRSLRRASRQDQS